MLGASSRRHWGPMSLSLQTENDFKSRILSASRQGKIITTVPPLQEECPSVDDIRSVRWLGNGTIHFEGRDRLLRNLGKVRTPNWPGRPSGC